MKTLSKLIALLTPFIISFGLHAAEPEKTGQQGPTPTGWSWFYVVNKTGGPIRVWLGGHRTYFDKDNYVGIAAGDYRKFWLRDKEAMNGPLYFQQALPGREFPVKTVMINGIEYEVIHSVKDAHFFPLDKNRGLGLEKAVTITPAGRYTFRVQQTMPTRLNIFQSHPYVTAEATTFNPLTGAYIPLNTVTAPSKAPELRPAVEPQVAPR